MTLTEELAGRRNTAATRIPEEKHKIMQASTKQLQDIHLSGNALKVGERLPEFQLPNAQDHTVSSKDLLASGPLVISFYRGGWCPYCNMELRALQRVLEDIKAKGAQLVAISPETPDNSLTTSEKNELTFEVLSDVGNAYAKELGLVFQMPEDLQAVYHSSGLDVSKYNGNEDYELPMPATYVIDGNGEVIYAFVPEDYTYRLDPNEIIQVLDQLSHKQ